MHLHCNLLSEIIKSNGKKSKEEKTERERTIIKMEKSIS